MYLCNSMSHTCFSLGQLRHKHFQDYGLKVVLPAVFFSISSMLSGVGMIFGEVMSNEAEYKGCRNKSSFPVSQLPGAIADYSSSRALALDHVKILHFSVTWVSQNIKQRTEKKLLEWVLLLYSKERQTCCFSSSTCLLVMWNHCISFSLWFLMLSPSLVATLPLQGWVSPWWEQRLCWVRVLQLAAEQQKPAQALGTHSLHRSQQAHRCAVQCRCWAPAGYQAK